MNEKNEKLNEIKEKAGETFDEIKTGFKADEGTTGFKAFTSSTKNLWSSSKAGKISIIAISLIAFFVIFGVPGGEKTIDIKEANAKSTGKNISEVACSNSLVKETVIGLAYRRYATDMAQMGIGPDRFSVENIRTESQQNSGCNCLADLAIDIGQKRVMPINYVTQLTDDGKPYVTVNGL